jgi:crotonobetainyl-CoA:carnitine CoA-transferase CaiB-like acyl-CoA transferase
MGVLDGVQVLDLSWGISGPAAAMLLGDHGADVIKIERPGGDPFSRFLDAKVYNRGKRSAILDLKDLADLETFLALADRADVLIESYAPGVTDRLGIDYDTLAARNPRLIYCSITAYGRDTSHADRPGYDALVAARTGYQWEVRAWPGSVADNIAGRDLFGPDTKIPESERHWLDRNGPVFTATPGPSNSAAYLATLGISGALRAREHTGRGQRVETSLLQGIIAYEGAHWQRFEVAAPNLAHASGPIMTFTSGVTIMSGPWCFYQCSDGGWVNNWTSRPEWAILAGAGDELRHPDPAAVEARVAETGGRGGSLERQLETRLEAIPIFAKFPRDDWVRLAAEAGVCMQPVRSPEEVLTDPALEEEGAVVDVDDPDLGTLRQPGILYRMSATPGRVRGAAARKGEHTDEVRRHARAAKPSVGTAATTDGKQLAGPLAGVRVLDFGLAVAGPWGGEMLAQLGAEVIKIDPPKQNAWLSGGMAMMVNRSKPHLSMDIKKPEGLAAAYEMVRQADVVMMNMRPQAAQKLGLDYETLKQINPSLVYCRTAGFDHSRETLPGNDQTGNSVGGTVWEDGGMAKGGRPYWSAASGGDLGNGYLSAIAMVQAIYHRDRTGEGQSVGTHIENAAMFANGRVYTRPDGTRIERPTLDTQLHGFHALYRLYECSEGWLCLAVFNEREWDGLVSAMPQLAGDSRFATADDRIANDEALITVLREAFLSDTAAGWFKILDQAGVPCEVSNPEFPEHVLDEAELQDREWFVSRPGHLRHGRVEMFGRVVQFSDTQAPILGPPSVPGQHSREILGRFGFTESQIDDLIAKQAVFEAQPSTVTKG